MCSMAYATGGDTFWIDSDLLPSAQASAVLVGFASGRQLAVPQTQSALSAEQCLCGPGGMPLLQAMAQPLRGFDYSSPSGLDRRH